MFVPMNLRNVITTADLVPAAAGGAAGLLLALLDVVGSPDLGTGWQRAVVFHLQNALVLGAAGTGLGALLALLGRIPELLLRGLATNLRGWGKGHSILHSLLVALPVTLVLSLPVASLFEGRWVSSTWLGAVGPSLASLAMFSAVWGWVLGWLWARGKGPVFRSSAAVLLLVAGAALGLGHRGLFPGLYLPFHDLAVLFSFGLFWSGFRLVVSGRALSGSPHGFALPALLALSLALLWGLAFLHLTSPEQRAVAWQRQLAVENLARNVRAIMDLDGDAVSPLFGGGDCNDLSAGINPFRKDVPENGVDEDCDGQDLSHGQATAAGAAWAAPPSPDVEPLLRPAGQGGRGYNLLVISVDALRYDHAFDERGDALLAALRPLQEHLQVFPRTYAPATTTQLSVPAIWTSRFSYWNAAGSIPADLKTVGFTTALFAHTVFAAQLADPGEGEYPGFDVYGQFGQVHTVGDAGRREEWGMGADTTTAGELSSKAVRWWLNTQGPRFAWVHFFDLHQWNQVREGAHLKEPAERYALVLQQVDQAMSALLDSLSQAGELRQTIIIFTADHGEGLGDHGVLYHTKLVYDVLARVPLAVYIPDGNSRVHDSVVSLLDLRPTIAQLAAVESGLSEGVSLAPALTGSGQWDRSVPVLVSDLYQQAVIHDGWKLVFDRFSHLAQLYNLSSDPLEEHSCGQAHPEVLSAMILLLKSNPNYLEPSGRAVGP